VVKNSLLVSFLCLFASLWDYFYHEVHEVNGLNNADNKRNAVLGSLNGVYQPPSKEQCKVLKDADLIWHGKAVSNSFRGNTSQD
jgi:hypothetical protein